MTSNEIRSSFLNYFEKNGHRIVPSSSLVPEDDPTLLFTNAGMNQFKDAFLGKDVRDYKRAASSQKCARAGGKHNDLENVGRTARHLTFFEMLGNFSFGDYFKADAIRFAWDLLVNVYKLDVNRLWFTVYEGDASVPADEEAAQQWVKAGARPDRVLRFGKQDNFWSMGDTGPCGPCSEIHYFRGDDLSQNVPDLVNGPGDDTMEIWNLVFMQYDRDTNGRLTPLPAPSIDTGAGLERLTSVLQKAPTIYDIDSFRAIMNGVAAVTGHKYRGDMHDELDTSARVLCDHSRSTTFLISDGVIPSNEGRGYVLRKIMRRAMRHGLKLGMNEPFLHRLVSVVVDQMGEAYPAIRTNRQTVEATILAEERQFADVLSKGLPRLEAAATNALAASGGIMAGEVAFQLYDTFGIPYDFIEDVAESRGVKVDNEGYARAMEGQRSKARGKSAFAGKKDAEFTFASSESQQGVSAAGDRFEGYTTTTVKGTPVVALFDKDRRQVQQLDEGSEGFAALGSTPFYVESGGQVSDVGEIRDEATGASARVSGMARISPGGPRLHRVQLTHGALHERDLITAEVDEPTRDATRRNHTATHLLHASLRKVLGPHVKQAGSLVAPDRLRFDFVHPSHVTKDQILEIERLVNEQVYRNAPVVTEERSTQEAIASGAMALFGEKYGDHVRVVSIPGFSMELCGGTHCRATGDIGFFAVTSESGVAAGVRRIEAVTGAAAVALHQSTRAALDDVLSALGTTADRARAEVEQLLAETKRLGREISKLKVEGARGAQGRASGGVEESAVGTAKFVAQRVSDLGKDEIRQLADAHRNRIKSGVVMIGSAGDGRVSLVVAVTKDLVPKVHAGQLVKQLAPIVGGSGGGRPDFAEAGGKDSAKIADAFAEGRRLVETLLS
ncbi:MAG TPA: alanine--tRNA ligase [Vicinamibacterales bacterium]|nr:alanine--tRNA ligase [Vicinamibacterales bacterium]